METISNISSAASKAIWGESNGNTTQSGTEPTSGEQGNGTVNDPYDHGNEEQKTTGTTGSHDTTSETHNTSAETTGSGTTGSSTVGSTGGNTNQPPATGTDTSASAASGPSNAASSSETGDPKSGQAPKTKQQGAGNPTEQPKEDKGLASKMPHSDEEREKMMEKGEFPHDPNDHSGEPLKMHSEKAPGEEKEEEEEKEEGKGEGKKDRSQSVAQEGGDPHGASKGTGQEVVKSSGMAADGGDFDATKPGAGVEANRLLEEKGVHKDAGNQGPPIVAEGDTKGTPKVSKIDKIKEKLHIGKH